MKHLMGDPTISDYQDTPFFSIITISYNQARYLGDCLKSVSSQGFLSYEHIVVDAGSTDASRKIILNHADPVKTIFESDQGPADGLNKGFNQAKGAYALFINADDYLLPSALLSALKILEHTSWPDILFLGGFQLYTERMSFQRVFPGSTLGFVHALGLSYFYQQGCIIKMTAFRQSHGFNISNNTCWDGELFLELLANSKTYAVRNPTPIAVFRIHGESITGSNRALDAYLSDRKSAVKHYYPMPIYCLSIIVEIIPSGIQYLLKYILDLRLFFWRLSLFI